MRATFVSYIALGSNLGDRLGFLQAGLDGLDRSPNLHIIRVSSVFESPAHVLAGQKPLPDYLNAVLECETSLPPIDLLDLCLSIESSLGRIRENEQRWAARTLDLDVIVYGDQTIHSTRLILPHPRLDQRLFVLLPLAEIAPNLILPAPFNQSVRYLLETCSDHSEALVSDHVLTMPGV